MNILLIGGTGAMGAHLASIFAAMGGVDVTITTRQKRVSEGNITYIQGDAHNLDFLHSVLSIRRWDAIVDFMLYTTAEFNERVESMLNATNQYVYLSSSRVYADTGGKITESSPRLLETCTDLNYLKSDEYALAKSRQEDLLRNSNKKNWTIVRPYVTFSEERIQLGPMEIGDWLYRTLKGRTLLISKDLLEKKTTLTYGEDVALCISSIIGRQQSLGETYNITTTESYTWGEILNVYISVIKNKTGIQPKLKIIEKWNHHLGGSHAQLIYDRLYNREFDNRKICAVANNINFNPSLQSIENCLSAFLSNPRFQTIGWTTEAARDRLTGEWTSLSEIKSLKAKLKYIIIRLGLLRRV